MSTFKMVKASTYGEWLEDLDKRGLANAFARTYNGKSRAECVRASPILLKQLLEEDKAPGPFECMIIQTGSEAWMAIAYSTVAPN